MVSRCLRMSLLNKPYEEFINHFFLCLLAFMKILSECWVKVIWPCYNFFKYFLTDQHHLSSILYPRGEQWILISFSRILRFSQRYRWSEQKSTVIDVDEHWFTIKIYLVFSSERHISDFLRSCLFYWKDFFVFTDIFL